MLVNTTGHCTSRRLARANANSTGSYTTQRDVSRLLQTQQVCSAKARAVRSATSQQQASTSSSSCPGRLLAAGHIGPVCIPSCKAIPSRHTRACAATMAAVAIPANFEAVMAVVAASFFVHHIFMALSVGSARRKYGVKYPDLYATKDNCPKEEDAKAFNCVQRGHQNSLENQPIFLSLLVCAGLKHPIIAAIAGFFALVGRVLYFTGYSTGVPNNRLTGSVIGYLGVFTLLGTTMKAVVVWGVSLMA